MSGQVQFPIGTTPDQWWKGYDAELSVPDPTDPRIRAEAEEFERRDPADRVSQETVEEYERLKEENTDAVKRYRFDQQEELRDEHMRLVNIISVFELWRRLRAIGVHVRYMTNPNALLKSGMIGMDCMQRVADGVIWKYICGVQFPMMPEYSVVRFDEHELPLGEKYRGWRTVLIRLVHKGCMTEGQALDGFGRESSGPVGRRWRQSLFELRPRFTLKTKLCAKCRHRKLDAEFRKDTTEPDWLARECMRCEAQKGAVKHGKRRRKRI
jgi:hypothetical protein